MDVKPLGDRVLVKPMTEEETTSSGIVLPDTVDKEKKAEGEIIAIGEGEKIQKLSLSVGDKVVFGKYAGDDIKLDEDEEFKFLNHDDILAVIK